jgi:hypothetical protein
MTTTILRRAINIPPVAARIVDRLAAFESVLEVGIGARTDVASALADRGVSVTATDVVERTVPAGVEFVVDDVTSPDRAVYAGTDALYAQRLPPELQHAIVDLAREVDAACFFTTLGGDPAVVPTTRETVESGTLFVARE